MKISVLIPYYNDAEFLPRSIESVLAQDCPDFELVLVNHATRDNCRELARSYDDARVVHVDMPENHGAGGGLVIEAFLAAAKGEYVKFFCADDVMRPGCLAALAAALDGHPELDMVFGDLEYIDEAGHPLGETWFDARQDFSRGMDELACLRSYADGKSVLPWIGGMVRRSALDRITLDATMVMMFDMSVWLQLLLNGSRLGYVDRPVAGYRIHGGQVSAAANLLPARYMSVFEWQAYSESLLRAEPQMLRRIFADDTAVAAACDGRELRCAIALRYLRHPELVKVSHWAYRILHDEMNTASGREFLSERFSLTVAGLRALLRASAPKERRRGRWVTFRERLKKLFGGSEAPRSL